MNSKLRFVLWIVNNFFQSEFDGKVNIARERKKAAFRSYLGQLFFSKKFAVKYINDFLIEGIQVRQYKSRRGDADRKRKSIITFAAEP